MNTCREIQPKLSSYIDGHGTAEERRALDAHLETCAGCRGVLRDLERLRAAARQLGPIAPPDHVWLEVAGQVRLDDPAARHGGGASAPRAALRQWIGLAAALVLVTIGAYFFLRVSPPASAPSNVPARDAVQAIADDLMLANQHYERAIAELETLAKTNSGALDPAIADLLRKNIAATDQAIAESRGAVTKSPESGAARESLMEALRRKVDVLQATVTLMNDMRRGDQAGAAESAAAIGKKG
jgi:Putative zinc-finger